MRRRLRFTSGTVIGGVARHIAILTTATIEVMRFTVDGMVGIMEGGIGKAIGGVPGGF